MKLFIPDIGTKLQLTEDWTIEIEWEKRNFNLLQILFPDVFEEYSKLRQNLYSTIYHTGRLGGYKALGFSGDQLYSDLKSDNIESKNRLEAATKWLEDKRNSAKQACINYEKANIDFTHVFPIGTILEVDRIYIRQGNKGFSSITFKIRDKKVMRFWAKLDDVNKIECDVLEDVTERKQSNIGGGANYYHG